MFKFSKNDSVKAVRRIKNKVYFTHINIKFESNGLKVWKGNWTQLRWVTGDSAADWPL